MKRLLTSRAFLGAAAPIVAVIMAFAVSGLIIIAFVVSYGVDDDVLARLKASGFSQAELTKLSDLVGMDIERREELLQAVDRVMGPGYPPDRAERIADEAMSRENPIWVYHEIFKAALKDRNGWANVLFRATPLILTGLAVALAVHCGLFNIGGEGQMVIGGFALSWVGFTFTGLPAIIHLPLCILAGFGAGFLWGAISGYLKAARGVHEVVSTIMLNWIAVALIQYLTLLYKPAESWIPHTYKIAKSVQLSRLWVYLNPLGIDFARSNMVNTALLLSLAAAAMTAWLLKKTKLGYEIKAVGHNQAAAENAGISVIKNTVLAMGISGGLAGLAGVNQVMGYKHRFSYGVFEGLGFDGIGVAFIGRNSPFGVVLAAILFGILDQGGLAIDVSTKVPREIVMVLKAVILIFVVLGAEITKRWLKAAERRRTAAGKEAA